MIKEKKDKKCMNILFVVIFCYLIFSNVIVLLSILSIDIFSTKLFFCFGYQNQTHTVQIKIRFF